MMVFANFGNNAIGIFPGRTTLQAGGMKAGTPVRFTPETKQIKDLLKELHALRRNDRVDREHIRSFDESRAGIRIDGPALAAQSHNIDRELAVLAARIYEQAGEEFNIASPKKLGEILFDKLGFRTEGIRRTTKTGAQSTSFEVLDELALSHELPRLILEWRALQKLKGTYIDALPQLVDPETGRVHTCFNQAVAATGRLSSSDPNLQNIPIRTELGREIRGAFVAEEIAVLKPDNFGAAEKGQGLQRFAKPAENFQRFTAVRYRAVNDLVVHSARGGGRFCPLLINLAGALLDGEFVFTKDEQNGRRGLGGGGHAYSVSDSLPVSLILSSTSLMSSTCSNRAEAT